MTGASFDARRPCLAAALVAAIICGAGASPAHAQQVTPFGSMFEPAHSFDVPTPDEIALALERTANIAGHASYMYEWQAGDAGLELAGTLVKMFRERGLKVFLQFAPATLGKVRPPEGVASSFWEPTAWTRYLNDVVRLAGLKPDYLNLCPEVDLMFALSPAEAVAYAALYKESYALVKQVSPETQVGVSYHMDFFFGRLEAWIPGFLGPYDYAAFTSYPGWLLHHGFVGRVADFPPSYYDRVRFIFPTVPVIFSEVGWPSAGAGTPIEQAEFVSLLPRLVQGARPTMVTWAMLRDTNRFQPDLLTDDDRALLESMKVDPAPLFEQFNSMGLVGLDGGLKPAYFAAEAIAF